MHNLVSYRVGETEPSRLQWLTGGRLRRAPSRNHNSTSNYTKSFTIPPKNTPNHYQKIIIKIPPTNTNHNPPSPLTSPSNTPPQHLLKIFYIPPKPSKHLQQLTPLKSILLSKISRENFLCVLYNPRPAGSRTPKSCAPRGCASGATRRSPPASAASSSAACSRAWAPSSCSCGGCGPRVWQRPRRSLPVATWRLLWCPRRSLRLTTRRWESR